MPAYEFCDGEGLCFDRIYLSWKDAPRVVTYNGVKFHRQFPNPAIRFKGPFSGSTTMLVHPDDGSVMEPGVKNEQKQKVKDVANKRDQVRKDFLAEQVSTYDV